MAFEIEHKYLVSNLSYREMAVARRHLRQGYLSRDPERIVRIRIADYKGFLTVKGLTKGDTRLELEYPVPVGEAEQMLRLCIPPVIEKTRYIVPFEGHTWEVDEFHHPTGIPTTAEIELSSSNTLYALPPFVGQNVTGDPAYFNSNL